MDPVETYGVVAGGMFAILFLHHLYKLTSPWIQHRTLFYVFKYLIYPTICRRGRIHGAITRWRAFLTLLYWLGTATCNIVGVKAVSEAGNRAGILSILYLIPLLFSSRLSFAADILGLSLITYNKLYGSVGFMACL